LKHQKGMGALAGARKKGQHGQFTKSGYVTTTPLLPDNRLLHPQLILF
jgi:hypothetical protein